MRLELLLLGLAGAGLLVSLAALLLVLSNDYDKSHREARRRNRVHAHRKGWRRWTR